MINYKLKLSHFFNGDIKTLDDVYNEARYYLEDINFPVSKDDIKDAVKYLVSAGYKKQDINLFNDDLVLEIQRAMNTAHKDNCTIICLEHFTRRLIKNIEEALGYTNEEPIEILSNEEFIEVKLDKAKVIKYLKENISGSLKYFLDKLGFLISKKAKRVNIILTDDCPLFDDWLDYFKESNTLEDKLNRVNDYELMAYEVKPSLDYISNYLEKYITNKEKKAKIARQIKALKSVIVK